MTPAAVEYSISGHTKINILNFRDIAKAFEWTWFQDDETGAWNSVGMFELSIDSERGISSRIGEGGIDISIGNIIEGIQGAGDLLRLTRISSQVGFKGDLVSSLNLAAHKETYGFGSEDWLMAQKILDGTYKVGLKNSESNEGGTFEGNTIYLNEKLFGDGFDSSSNIEFR